MRSLAYPSRAMQDDDNRYPTPPDPLAGREEEFGDLPPAELRDLPPVEPPSAGFILQLFLVPALIVTVVIGVYLLFGQLAAGEQDWRKQLTDIRSDNPHVRWRGALGLADMLNAGTTAEGVRLAENRDVATELADLLSDSLSRPSSREDDYKQQEFLARTLGLIDVPEVTFPVLVTAMDPAEDRDVRKNAIAALATASYRLHEQGRDFDESAAVPAIIAATDDSDALIRHLATYALGLFEAPDAQQRLEVLLEQGDEATRVNAAVGLARHGSLAGLPTFEEVLRSSSPDRKGAADSRSEATSAESNTMRFEELTNTLKALGDLRSRLDAESRARLVALLSPLAEQHADSRIRVEAQTLLTRLKESP